MEKAIAALERGATINKTAKQYGIGKAALLRHYLKENIVQILGRTTVLEDVVEVKIKRHILLLEELMFGLTINEVRELAFDIAEEMKIPHKFNKQQRMAGKKWYYGFMRRHPELSLRAPEATSLARVRGFRQDRVYAFFDLLEKTVQQFGIGASRIYNMHETGISTVQKHLQKIVGQKGKKQIGKIKSAERGVTSTAVCCVSAAGHYIPPMLIFKMKNKKGEDMPPELQVGKPQGSIITVSDTGYINKALFLKYLHHFKDNVNSSEEHPVILLLDGHTTHSKNLEALTFARENGIMIQLPSHTTHSLQSLDIGFFGPLQGYFAQPQSTWLADPENIGQPITIHQIPSLFRKAYNQAATLGTAENSFAGCGIWPLNRLKFPAHLFSAAVALSQEELSEAESDSNEPHEPDEVENVSSGEIVNPPAAATTALTGTATPSSGAATPSSGAVTSASIQSVLQKIFPLPKANSKGKKRSGRLQKDAVVLTEGEYLLNLTNEIEKRNK